MWGQWLLQASGAMPASSHRSLSPGGGLECPHSMAQLVSLPVEKLCFYVVPWA